MDELTKYLIDKLKSRPVTSEVLIIAAILTATFSAIQYFGTNPEAVKTINNCYFQAFVIIALSIWVASLCWRYAKIRTLRIITSLAFLILGVVGATTVINTSHIKHLKIRVFFDESVNMPPTAMSKLVSLLRSELYHVEISDKALNVNTSTERTITDEEVRSVLNAQNLLKTDNDSGKALPILITGKMLRSPRWSNLLMINWGDAVVISVWGIGAEASLTDSVVRNYVATSIANEPLVSFARRHKKPILEARSPELYTGCLNDFHRTRQTYIVQSQKPAYCGEEEIAIKAMFGEATVKELKNIFKRISEGT